MQKNRRKSGELQGIPILVYGRQQVDVERKVWGDYVRCMPAAREGAIGETNVHSSIMCLFLAVIWLHSFLSGCEHLMYAFVFCISSLFPSFWFSSPSLLVGLFSVAPCKSSLLLHRFSIIFFICDFTQFYTWVYFFLFLF